MKLNKTTVPLGWYTDHKRFIYTIAFANFAFIQEFGFSSKIVKLPQVN